VFPTRIPTSSPSLSASATADPTTSPSARPTNPAPVPTASPTQFDTSALMALYEDLGGSTWSSHINWGTAAPLDTWQGVSVNEFGRVNELDLTGIGLQGTFPSSVALLTALQVIRFGRNELVGTLPTWIGVLSNLNTFVVWRNQFVGTIPYELVTLPNLQKLNIRMNMLTGTLPTVLGTLTNLTQLEVDSNSLTGTISDAFCNSATLFMMFAGDNSFTCYDACVPALGVFEYLTSEEYPVCVTDIERALCSFGNAVMIADMLPTTLSESTTVSYDARAISHTTSLTDGYYRYEANIVSYTITFDRYELV
jgi:hypothetical protein